MCEPVLTVMFARSVAISVHTLKNSSTWPVRAAPPPPTLYFSYAHALYQ